MRIKINYDGHEIEGDEIVYSGSTKNALKELQDIIEKAVSGKISYLTIVSGSRKYYFGKKVLQKAIIVIID